MEHLSVKPEYRALQDFEPSAIDTEKRTVTLTGSSELAVERYDWESGEVYDEILSHDPADVDLSRMLDGGPVLDRHRGDQIAVVEAAEIRDGKSVFTIRFSSATERARVIFEDVIAGIRRNVSVGYLKTEIVSSTRDENGRRRVVFRWQPYEISFEPVPADPTVGVGREQAENTLKLDLPEERGAGENNNLNEGEVNMAEETTKTTTAPVAEVRGIPSDRMANLYSLAATLNAVAEVRAAIKDNKDEAEILDLLMRKQGAKPVGVADASLGMDKKEVRRYSFRKALLAQMTGDWSEAGLEKEASDAVAKQMNRSARGFFIPFDVMTAPVASSRAAADFVLNHRDLIVGSDGTGKNLVREDLLTDDFIAVLRNATFLDKVGAFFLSGLRDNIAIPRMTSPNAYYWVAEQSQITKSTAAFDQVSMTPKQLGAMTLYSRLFLQQASLGVESFVRAELAITLAQGIDWGTLYGAGIASNQPLGLFNRAGIGTVAIGDNGGAPTAATLVDMETAVADKNVIENDTMAYLTNARVRGALKKTPILSNTAAIPIWSALPGVPGAGEVNGYPAYVSNVVAKNGTKGTGTGLSSILFGKWSDLVVGFWGGLDVIVDPYTGAAAGDTRVVAFQSVDIATRHDESFCKCTDVVAGGADDDSSSSSSSN